MKKKRILVTASTFPRWKGDTEPRFILDLSEALSEYYDITVLVPFAPGALAQERMGNVEVIRYHYFPIHKWETLCYPGAIVPRIKEKKIRILLVPFLFLALYWQLWKRMKDYDLVHAHWVIPQGMVQSLFKKKYIVTGHGSDIMSLNKGILRKFKNHVFQRASKVVVVSDLLREKVKEITPMIQPEILSMGCDTTMFSPKYRKENYFEQKQQKVVLFVGRLEEVKGVEYLIDAMEHIDAKLVIAGSGSLEQSLKDRAAKYGEKIAFIGTKTHDELRECYASADVFAMPSVTTSKGVKEGLGLVILEAMASGLPVAAFASGGITQLIKHEENGLLCEEKDVKALAENINCLLWEEELREKLIENSNKTVTEYDYKEIAKKYSKIYAEVLLEK